MLAAQEGGSRQEGEAYGVVVTTGIDTGSLVERRAMNQIDRQAAIGKRCRESGKAGPMGADAEFEVTKKVDFDDLEPAGVDARIERQKDPDIVADAVEVARQSRTHVTKTAGLGERCDLGRSPADSE